MSKENQKIVIPNLKQYFLKKRRKCIFKNHFHFNKYEIFSKIINYSKNLKQIKEYFLKDKNSNKKIYIYNFYNYLKKKTS